MIHLLAPAKLNLTLDVLRRRPDGFHELRTILQTVSLADELSLEASDEVRVSCSDPALAGPSNLVGRAAALLRDRAGVQAGAAIHLEKRIPTAAGLGGGSSDAAATLLGLNRLWRLDWPRERLLPIAALLGSDVPFFLWGGTALAEGRGERITTLPPLRGMWFVLIPRAEAAPDKTRRVFAALSVSEPSGGVATDRVLSQLRAGRVDPAGFSNDLAAPARRLFPDVERAFAALAAAGAQPHLSGAGPSVFAATTERDQAELWKAKVQAQGLEALIVEPVSSER